MSDCIVSDIQSTIRARILYCTYELKSTLLFASRREFAHFSIRYNWSAHIVLCLWNEKHACIWQPKGISLGWTDYGILNSFASDCQHGRITFSKAEKCRKEAAWLRETTPQNTRNSTKWSLKIFEERPCFVLIQNVKVHLTPKYFFRLNKSLHLF